MRALSIRYLQQHMIIFLGPCRRRSIGPLPSCFLIRVKIYSSRQFNIAHPHLCLLLCMHTDPQWRYPAFGSDMPSMGEGGGGGYYPGSSPGEAGGMSPCEMSNQCCGMAAGGAGGGNCCIGGQRCTTVWKKSCSQEDSPECRQGPTPRPSRSMKDLAYSYFSNRPDGR